MKKYAAISILALSVSGCQKPTGDANNLVTYTSKTDYLSSLFDNYADFNVTDPTTLPASGSANYTGVIAIEEAVGDLVLVANFSDNEIRGKADNFLLPDDSLLPSSLEIFNGQINRSADPDVDPVITADIEGTLGDECCEPAGVFGTMYGTFVGADHSAIFGYLEGDLRTADGDFILSGSFAAEQ